jgi:hypothetical protein
VVRAVLGGLGLVAMLAAIVVGSLAALGILSDAPTSPWVGGSQANATEEATQAESRVIDESVSAGKLGWTIDEARRISELHAYTLPPSTLHGDFVVVTFSVKNTSDGPVTLTDDSMALVGDEGLTGRPTAVVNSEYVVPEKGILFNERGLLEPGEEKKGRVNFDLRIPFGVNPSADLTSFRLKLGDGDPTVEEERLVDLGL